MNTKHTPGPWANDDGIITAGEKRCFVAEVNYGLGSGPSDACDANARLIAAAPDLLNALLTILGPLKVAHNNPNVRDDECLPVDMTMGELRQAWAAIAKALGQEGGAL